MGSPDGATGGMVLRRKAAGGRPPPPEPVAPRALRRALARAAEADCGLALGTTEVRGGEASLAELLERPEPMSLLAVLEGPGDRLGLLALGPQVLAGLIEQQTTGAVLAGEAPPRRPTRTDAAMCAGLIDRALAELEAGLAGLPELAWAGGYRYASFLDDPRPLGLLLEDVLYRLLDAEVELAGGLRRGPVLLALPADTRRRSPPAGLVAAPAEGGARAADSAAATPDAREWQAQMTRTVMASPATLEAVLCRFRLPLATALRWQPGDFVPLPGATLETVALEAPGGRRVGRARLGQSRGQRALRLALPDPLPPPGSD